MFNKHPINTSQYGMTCINNFDDARIFAGKIVAFKTSCFSFCLGEGHVLDDSVLRYALISEQLVDYHDGDVGYKISVLLNKEEIPHDNYLFDSRLRNANMRIRLVSKDELGLIKAAINDDKAKFAYEFDKDEIIELLDKQISEFETVPHNRCILI